MRRVFLLLMAALPICATNVRAAPECGEGALAVTVQLYDYVHLPSERLSRAMEIVTGLYERIGVRIDWLGVSRRDTGRVRSTIDPKTPRVPIAQITVNILTPAMAARGRIPEGVLGLRGCAQSRAGWVESLTDLRPCTTGRCGRPRR